MQILEAIASNALKKFGSYVDPMTNKHILLLDNRKVFSTDRAHVKAAANRMGVPFPKCKPVMDLSPARRPRRQIEEPQTRMKIF